MTYPPDRMRVSGINPNYDKFSGEFKPMRVLVKEIYDMAKKGDMEKAVQIIYAKQEGNNLWSISEADKIINMMNEIKDADKEIIKKIKMGIKEKRDKGFKVNEKVANMVIEALRLAVKNGYSEEMIFNKNKSFNVELYVPAGKTADWPTVNEVMNNPDLLMIYCGEGRDTICHKVNVPPFLMSGKPGGKPDMAKISDHFDNTRFSDVYKLEIKQNPNGEYEINGKKFDIRIR